jgi:squalene-hopene/tetraprenyl-beta-curcumene cyclase
VTGPARTGPRPAVGAALDPAVRDAAVRASTERLLATQLPDGSWANPRPGAVSGAAGAVLALHLAGGQQDRTLIEHGCTWLLQVRNPDGGWGTLAGSPSDVVATSMAVAALSLAFGPATAAADGTAAAAVDAGLAWVAARDSVTAVADTTVRQLCQLVLALAGYAPAGRLRRVPLELVLLPAALRRKLLSYLSPPFVALALLQRRFGSAGRVAQALSRLSGPAAVRLLGEVSRQEGDVGSFGGDPWLTGLVATALTVSATAPELVESALEYLRSTAQPDGSWSMIHGMAPARIEVTGPAFAAAALGAAGLAGDPRLAATRAWLVDCQQRRAFPLYDCPPGGWTWSGPKGWPNVLDSLAVLEVLLQGRRDDPALRDGVAWLLARQDRRGSWSTFVRNTLVPLDGPCPYITAKALLVLAESGIPADHRAVVRGLRWLRRAQRPDGLFEALWHRGPVPATAAVLRLFGALGLDDGPTACRAAEALLTLQRPDGSWSTDRPEDPGTVDETARAVLALTASGRPGPARRGGDWLVRAQRPDGSWPEGQTCVYIRHHVHYSDHLMAQGLALSALTALGTKPVAGAPAGLVRLPKEE